MDTETFTAAFLAHRDWWLTHRQAETDKLVPALCMIKALRNFVQPLTKSWDSMSTAPMHTRELAVTALGDFLGYIMSVAHCRDEDLLDTTEITPTVQDVPLRVGQLTYQAGSLICGLAAGDRDDGSPWNVLHAWRYLCDACMITVEEAIAALGAKTWLKV